MTYAVNVYPVIDARIFTVSLFIFPITLQIDKMYPHFSEGQSDWVTYLW